jgi:hypothetical protein
MNDDRVFDRGRGLPRYQSSAMLLSLNCFITECLSDRVNILQLTFYSLQLNVGTGFHASTSLPNSPAATTHAHHST